MTQHDFESIANRMRNRARSGEYRGGFTLADFAHIKHCTARVGNTKLVFTYDAGQYGSWLSDPAHDRCWHLSISDCDALERDVWLRAFFGDQLEHVWGQPPETCFGERNDVWHWRLFCDDRLQPLVVRNAADLVAAGLRRANEYGVHIVPRDLAA